METVNKYRQARSLGRRKTGYLYKKSSRIYEDRRVKNVKKKVKFVQEVSNTMNASFINRFQQKEVVDGQKDGKKCFRIFIICHIRYLLANHVPELN